ncbi:uncharacterized protein [Chironomus tepperi]|uniref:uncharacterized protein n=1 Tax=Chironomus tepperi TaxID=113505 RepID=UPI00391F3E1E
MRSSRIILEFFTIILCFDAIYGQEVNLVWGFVNSDSMRIDVPAHYTINNTNGTIASQNATMRASRPIHGVTLKSINSPGASGQIIEGGPGFNFVTFMLQSSSSSFYFIAEVYENNTSGIETTTAVPTTPMPEKTLQEWGVVNSGSVTLNPKTYHHATASPGQIAQHTVSNSVQRIIHGIRVISYNDTAASAIITDGGIGSNFSTIIVYGRSNFVTFSIELYENGSTTTPAPTTTTTVSTTVSTTVETTPIPESRVEEWGKLEDVAYLEQKTFENNPPIWSTANDNATVTVNGVILGIRLTSLNYTTGLYELIDGGLEQNFVTFNFRGSRAGAPYLFKVEIFGNSSVTVKMSMTLIIMLTLIYNLIK